MPNNPWGRVNTGREQSIESAWGAVAPQAGNASPTLSKKALESDFQSSHQQEVDFIKVKHKSRREQLQAAKANQLQVLQDICDRCLVRNQAGSRAETFHFLLNEGQKLMEEAELILDYFIENIEVKAKVLDSVKAPGLQGAIAAEVDREVQAFFNLQHQLTEKFRNIELGRA